MIAIIDYGLGNVLAFINVYKRLNIPAVVAKSVSDLAQATRLVLPGVGSFDHAMRELERSGMKSEIERLVFQRQIPVLGVCVGMQMLAKTSEEGVLPGLGWIDGNVKKFALETMLHTINLPHMGWNDVKPIDDSGLFSGMGQKAQFYFLHSYFFQCNQEADVLAVTDYDNQFASAVRRGNVYGVQFHPEKSHHFGSQLLKNFAEI